MLSVFDQGAHPPCPKDFNLAKYVLQKADDLQDKIALAILRLSGSERWSYAKLKSAVLGTGAGYLSLGLRPGQKVLLRLGNTVDFPIAYLGAIAVGLVPIPTSAQLTESEVDKIIAIVAPDIIVAGTGISCPDGPETPILSDQTLRTFRELPPANFHLGDPNRLAYILFTSGTSSKPRPVMHAHRAIWARQMMWDGWYDLTENDRLLHAGAFNWSFTLGTGLLDPWSVGATAMVPAEGITVSALPLLLKRHDVSLFAAAPGVYRQILKDTDTLILPKLRHGLCAGEKLSSTIHAAWKTATEKELYEAFGMSECSTFISSSPDHPSSDNLGRPQKGRRVAIMGEDGPVEIGNDGQIAVHKDDAGLMLGYLDDPEGTKSRFQGDWFLTGDVGSMDNDFSVIYHARADDIMNAGGFRVSPLEVEAALSTHPEIHEVAVTDIEIKPDVRVISAFYTANQDIADTALETYVSDKLARYKQPRVFKRVATLPRGANNKLLRKQLRTEVNEP